MKRHKQSDKLKIVYKEEKEGHDLEKEKLIDDLSNILKKIEHNLNITDESIHISNKTDKKRKRNH